MPLYMDIHRGMSDKRAEEIVEAHKQELQTMGRGEIRIRDCWYGDDGIAATVFCLAEAPNADAFENLHGRTLGVRDEIIEVH